MKKEDTNNRSVAYLPATTALSEWNRMVMEVSEVGVAMDRTTVGGSFASWSAQLEAGQVAWIYTLEQFGSLTELMSFNESMERRGVTLRSVREPWFNDPAVLGSELLGHLFRLGESIHGRRLPFESVGRRNNCDGLGLSDPKVALIEAAIELRIARNMSVVSACRIAGCGVGAYYRYLKLQKR